ncbi:MAG: hypothetical protein MK108_02970 [Mariniblastus sp.]|nr:hypothetical protein [Mariniblastus sp.]
MELFFLFLIVVAFFGFAVAGFILTIRGIIRLCSASSPASNRKRNKGDDLVATAHLINEFWRQDKIGDDEFERLRKLLEEESDDTIELPQRRFAAKDGVTSPGRATVSEPVLPISPADPVDEVSTTVSASLGQPVEVEPLSADAGASTNRADAAAATSGSQAPEKPAPWDLPDPPAPKPRRALADILANFMQEKNIRWGELASGILIVGFSILLVASLRQQLTETIPYFPALLFLLITAAIHGAGSYTLRKWKLRNTSPGILVIGLFMVPLNFLAACLLCKERPLADPVYWVAMLIGVAAFTAMSWWSSKLLFRRGYGWFVSSLLGLSVMTLVVNRLADSLSVWAAMGLTLPIGLLVLAGSGLASPLIRSHQYWTERSLNRVYLWTGIPLFGALTVLVMWMIRSSERSMTLVALTPLLLFLSLLVSCLGWRLLNNRNSNLENNHQVIHRALVILGLMMAGIALMASVTLPVVLMLNSLLLSLMIWTLGREYQLTWLRPVAGFGLATACLVASNVLFGGLTLNQVESARALGTALFSGQSGLTLMALGGVLAACCFLFAWRQPVDGAKPVRQIDLLSAVGIGVAGCALSLLAGLLHRDSLFDTMTASGLLGIAAVVTLALAVCQSRPWWPAPVAALLSLAALTFSTLWNPTITQWLGSLGYGYTLNGVTILVTFSLMFSLASALASVRSDAERVVGHLAGYAGLAASIASVTGFCLAFRWPDLGVGVAIAGSLCWLSLAWSLRGPRSQLSEPAFLVSTALLGIAVLVGFSSSFGIPPWTDPGHWLVQCAVLGVWSIVWMLAARWSSGRVAWLLGNHPCRGEQIILVGIVTACSFLLVMPLIELTGRQLSGRDLGLYDAQGQIRFLIGAYVSVFAAALISFWIKPTQHRASYLVIGWLLGWSLFAFGFAESVSVGSALRWLLSLCCLVTSAGVLWLVQRTVRERGLLDSMVNQFLVITAGVVLLISSLTVAGVMLHGEDSLGGPQAGSWFASMPAEVSYGVPAVLLTTAFLVFAIALSRQVLAVLGSATYQYVVLFMLVLLFLSPHPSLATGWFLNILQAVSVGMSLYGFAWWLFRKKITVVQPGAQPGRWIGQLELHTLINGLLVTSFAVLVMAQVFFWPDQSGGWVNRAGSPLGLISLFLVAGLACLVGRSCLSRDRLDALSGWLITWFGLVLSALLAALLDTHTGSVFIGVRTLIAGGLLTSLVLNVTGILWDRHSAASSRLPRVGPLVFSTVLVVWCAFRAAQYDPLHDWGYLTAIGLAILLVTVAGIWRGRFGLQYIAALYGLAGISLSVMLGVMDSPLTTINLTLIVWLTIGLAWSAAWLKQTERPQRPWIEFLYINVLTILTCSWVGLMSLWQLGMDAEGIRASDWSGLFRPSGIALLAISALLLVLTTWNRGARLRLVTRFIWTQGLTIALISCLLRFAGLEGANLVLWVSFGVASLLLGWGMVWAFRRRWMPRAERWGIPRLVEMEQALRYELPIYVLLTGSLVFLVSWAAIVHESVRSLRYLAALTPFLIAIGVGCLSDANKRRWLQMLSLLMVTDSLVLVALADLPESATNVQWLVRLVLVLAATMFIYGGLVARWSRSTDSWLRSLRDMASLTCGLAISCLGILVACEFIDFGQSDRPRVPVVDSIGVAVAVLGMIVGLVTIALRPKFDPFSMSVRGRTAYVYAAQGVVVLLCLHLYLTMPWLFQFGLAKYWPYLMIVIAFGGVAVANLLQQRQLTVLAQPLFNTAAALPVLVAIGVLAVRDTPADPSLVLLGSGLLYLMLSYTHKSVLSGSLAIVLGNVALWLFYHKFPRFSFFEHPQLWLIPPAISVMVAGQIARSRLTRVELASLRYVCLATIYLSSTSGIFIHGLGEEVFPSFILAVLSVIGILAGIAFRIRAFLYLGTLFLLLSMLAMVYRAQRALDHTWPWWAFGICMGIAILVMFGLFEKRRNKMKQIADQLQQWDL